MTNIMTNPKALKFFTEKYENENKHIRLHEEFIAVPGLTPVSGKFYTKHDVLSTHDAPVEYVNLIKRCAVATPKDNYTFPPPCVNMDYGWFIEPLVPRTSDKRLAFYRKQCEIMKFPKSKLVK